ncbi:MAG: endo-1,4-beta-xylanase [Phycisphaeraceae bacterium]|nr:endo-1,4-beta-xylanase [Phycisphaeraceae bacterium]
MSRIGEGGEEWRALEQERKDAYQPDEVELAESRRDIERYRTGDAVLRLIDRRGRPVAGEPVRIVLKRHAFWFGDNLWGLDGHVRQGLWDTDHSRIFRKLYAGLFNAANALCYWTERPRNDGPKTEEFQGEPKLDAFARIVDWVVAEGMYCKAHPLFWSIPKAVPDWVMKYDAQTRMRFIEVRVRNMMARFGGKVTMWDAINEPLWEASPRHLEDRYWPHLETATEIADYIEPVIRWSRQEQPDVRLVINEYGMEAGQDRKAAVTRDGIAVTADMQRKRMLELITELQQRNASPNGIGLQSHTGGFITRAQQHELYSMMASTGLAVQVTEFWAPKAERITNETEREEMITRYVLDHLTHAFAHPALEAFFFWGLTGKMITWRGNTNAGYELSPRYEAVRQLIHDNWHTSIEGQTDDQGCIAFRGYFGDYAVRIGRPEDSRGGYHFQLPSTFDAVEPVALTIMVEQPTPA